MTNVRDLFKNIGCEYISVIKLYRIGKYGSKSARPLKVELQSVSDRNYVLLSSKCIKNSNTEFKVSENCIELNSRVAPLQNGNVVRSGRLMTRDNNGKLQPASPADNKSIKGKSPNKVADNQVKNRRVEDLMIP